MRSLKHGNPGYLAGLVPQRGTPDDSLTRGVPRDGKRRVTLTRFRGTLAPQARKGPEMPVGQSQVIVGASAAGVSAALGMREAGYGGDIVLIDADPNLPYERPPLSKSLVGGSPAGLRPIVPAASYVGNHIDLRLGVAVTALDPANRRVELADGSWLNPDHVILATGLAARRLDVPGAALRNVMTLRDAADSASLTARLALGGPLAIVGAGFIGLELAAVAATTGIDVTVIEIASAPLGPVLGSEVGHLVEKLHTLARKLASTVR